MTNFLYNDYSSWIKQIFDQRVQKISIDAGFTCPNRDGTKGNGGCIYCDNKTFSPYYCNPAKSISQQINEGIAFFSPKYKVQKYIAYFQAYTNTYKDTNTLEKYYREALSHPDVIGLVIATRPDCLSEETIELLKQINKKYYLVVEFGVESTSNETLKAINRGHTWEDSKSAIQQCSNAGIKTGAHLIFGLPGEDKTTILNHAINLSKLPVAFIKIHQLQIIKNTKLAELYKKNPLMVNFFTIEEYIDLVIDFIEHSRQDIIFERFLSESPVHKIIAPNWRGIKNFEFVHRLKRRMEEREAFQGKCWQIPITGEQSA